MPGKDKLLIIICIAVWLLSAFGLYRLFALRFATGDIFPPNSSLRSDPLGCKALFMALERLPEMEVTRNFRDLDRLKGVQGRTIFYLGAGEALFNAPADKQTEELEALARDGNRLVIALVPAKGGTVAKEAEKKTDAGNEEADEDDENDENDEEKPQNAKADSSQDCGCKPGRMGVGTGFFDPAARPDKGPPMASLTAVSPDLPPVIPLHSRRWLQPNAEGWRPVYSYLDKPVILERSVGKGSIVLMADSYLVSNEALRNDRKPGLLAWLQGPNRAALFDESHLGVRDNPGVMTLIRKHRLVPFLIALMALAALYVWKIAVPFANTTVPLEDQQQETPRDNFSGLVNLLRRNITPAELLDTCFREWSRSFASESRQRPAMEEQIKAIVAEEEAPSGKRDPVAVYRKVAELLSSFRMR